MRVGYKILGKFSIQTASVSKIFFYFKETQTGNYKQCIMGVVYAERQPRSLNSEFVCKERP